MSKSRMVRSLAIAGALLASAQVHAVPLSFSGSLARDDSFQVFAFQTTANAPVRIETFGYAGGTDANGRAIASGGFDPVFALFTAAGALLGYGDDGASRTDPGNGAAFDALLTQTLAAGSYFVAISQWDNFAIGPNFSNGFLETGNATFTAAYGCSAGKFCDINGFSRSANFDISISGAQVGAVPEPGTLASMALGLLGLLGLRLLRLLRRNPSSTHAC